MSIVKLKQSFSFLTAQDWDWVVTAHSATSITISDGTHTQIITGNFTYGAGDSVSGTATGTEYKLNGVSVYTVTGVSDSAEKLAAFANTAGDTQATYAYTLRGNDTIYGSAGNDTLMGYAGNDTYKYTLGHGSDIIRESAGIDALELADPNNLFIGWDIYRSSNNLVLDFYGKGRVTVTNHFLSASTIEKLALPSRTYDLTHLQTATTGNDFLVGTTATEILKGLAGEDLIFAGLGNDTLYGGADSDEIHAGGGNDTVYGEAGYDEIYGEAGNDKLYAGNDDDELNGGLGADILNGGTGWDRAQYMDQTAGIVVNLSGQNKTVGGVLLAHSKVLEKSDNLQDTLVAIEAIDGSKFADVFYGGNNINEHFLGYAGNDTVYSGAVNTWTNLDYWNDPAAVIINLSNAAITANGKTVASHKVRDGWGNTDSIVLGQGQVSLNGSNFNDYIRGRDDMSDGRLSGGKGNDIIHGGTGVSDTASYDDGSSAGIIANLSAATVTANGFSVAANHARDGYGNTDTLISIESIAGTIHNDYIVGSSANNPYLNGRFGNDTIIGGGGNDNLYGDDGNDLLIGGSGRDNLDGGAANDRFDFNALSELGMGGSRDLINNFTVGQDKIDLSTIDAKASVAGDQAFAFVSSFTASAGQVRYSGGIIYLNTDTDLAAEYEIQLTGSLPAALTAAAFVL